MTKKKAVQAPVEPRPILVSEREEFDHMGFKIFMVVLMATVITLLGVGVAKLGVGVAKLDSMEKYVTGSDLRVCMSRFTQSKEIVDGPCEQGDIELTDRGRYVCGDALRFFDEIYHEYVFTYYHGDVNLWRKFCGE